MLQLKTVERDEEGYYITIKGSIHQDEIFSKYLSTYIYIYIFNICQILVYLRGNRKQYNSNMMSVPRFQQWLDHTNRKSVRQGNKTNYMLD